MSAHGRIIAKSHLSDPAANLAIIIVNWNSGDLLSRCIASINDAQVTGIVISRIVIIDNNSTDGSVGDDRVASWPTSVMLIRNSSNIGFAAACNVGADATTAPILLFLNPDMELNSSSLARPLGYLEQDHVHRVGMIGIRLLDGNGDVQRCCARFPTAAQMLGHAIGLDRLAPWLLRPHFMLEWNHNETRIVDQVMGAFAMIRRTDFKRLGGFDERFFLYMEDVDLALRLKQAGQDSVFLHTASAKHIGCGTTKSIKAARLAYAHRSRIIYVRKHFGQLARGAVIFAMLVLEPGARLLYRLMSRQFDETRAVMSATNWLWRHYPFNKPQDKGEIDL